MAGTTGMAVRTRGTAAAVLTEFRHLRNGPASRTDQRTVAFGTICRWIRGIGAMRGRKCRRPGLSSAGMAFPSCCRFSSAPTMSSRLMTLTVVRAAVSLHGCQTLLPVRTEPPSCGVSLVKQMSLPRFHLIPAAFSVQHADLKSRKRMGSENEPKMREKFWSVGRPKA